MFAGIFILVIVAVGCATASDRDSPSTRVETTDGRMEKTESTSMAQGRNAPPDSTLEYDGRSATGGLGSFCWNSMCADAPGVPVPKEKHTLAVSRDSVMEFRFGGKERLTSVVATAYPIDRGNAVGEMGGGRILVSAEGNSDLISEDLRVRERGNEILIPADIPAGEYVVDVFIQAPRKDASYVFRVMVRK